MSQHLTAREKAAELLRLAAAARRTEYTDSEPVPAHVAAMRRAHRIGRARDLIERARILRAGFPPLP